MAQKKPNILLMAIDSLKSTHMSCYGYSRLTTPHIDRFSGSATLFENTFSPHIPTTPAYASMLTGRDCFATQVVALRHQGPLTDKVRTLPEILRDHGYHSTCVGFNPCAATRGFDTYLNYERWGAYPERLRKAERLNDVALPEIERLAASEGPWFMLMRHMDPHSPYLPPEPFDHIFYQGNEYDPENKSMEPVYAFTPFKDFLMSWIPPGVTDKEYAGQTQMLRKA